MSDKVTRKYPNGKKKLEYSSMNGKAHGTAKWWSESGRLRAIQKYQNGQRHGIEKEWSEIGVLLCENYYLYGKEVTEEEYRKHELIEGLACLK